MPEASITSVKLRAARAADLQVGDYVLVDHRYIGRVAKKGATFFTNMPYIDVTYTVVDDSCSETELEEKSRRYFTDYPLSIMQLAIAREEDDE